MIRTIQIKLKPPVSQGTQLEHWLDSCRHVYNSCLEQRINAYKQSKIWPTKPGNLTTKYGQQGQLPVLKNELPEFAEINAQILQDTVGRVDKAFQAFFKRNKVTKIGGFPRFKSKVRFNSFTHPQASAVKFSQDSRKFYLPSFGWIKYHKQGSGARSLIEGKLKTCTIKRQADGWYALFSVELSTPLPFAPTHQAVGIDLGLSNLVTLSNGEVLGSLTKIKQGEKKLRLIQTNLSRKVKGSKRRKANLAQLQQQSLRLQRTKTQQLHSISKNLVKENDTIVVEDLNVKGMLEKPSSFPNVKGLHRNIGLASWGTLVEQLVYKAEEAGRLVIKVDPRNTSQMCSGCGTIPLVKKDLSVRQHVCQDCGLVLDRDHNAALNILMRGLNNKGGTPPSRIVSPIRVDGNEKSPVRD